ncbi:hypothetical protein ABK040_014945 [Willaertia magna]
MDDNKDRIKDGHYLFRGTDAGVAHKLSTNEDTKERIKKSRYNTGPGIEEVYDPKFEEQETDLDKIPGIDDVNLSETGRSDIKTRSQTGSLPPKRNPEDIGTGLNM